MSFQKKMPGVYGATKAKSHLDHMLDFGPEKPESTGTQSLKTSDLNRLQQIVKKLQEINKRIDDLSSRI